MICSYCQGDHNELLAGRFCEHCGRSIAPPPTHDTDPDNKRPGGAEPARCPQCALETEPGATRCRICGTRLKTADL